MLKIKHYLSLLLATTLLLGGCQSTNHETESKQSETQKEDLPKTKAFQDEFTRSFIHSLKIYEDSYYMLESKTGQYQMLLPVGGVVNDFSYSKRGTKSEFYTVSIQYADGSEAAMQISYNGELSNSENIIQYSLDSLKNDLDIKVPFQKMTTTKNQLYVAPFELTYKGSTDYGYGGYIYPSRGQGGITFHYSEECLPNEQPCTNASKKNLKNNALKIMGSIQFYSKEKDRP